MKHDLAEIRRDLQRIADVLGPGRAYESLMPDGEICVPGSFPLSDLMQLVPPAYRTTGKISPRLTTVTLPIPDLFAKVESGKVVVTLGFLAEHLPLDCLGFIPPREADQPVLIPISWISNAFFSEENEATGIPWSRWMI